jgi:hypothetical protein
MMAKSSFEVDGELEALRREREGGFSLARAGMRAAVLAGLVAGSWALVVGFATVMISAVRVAGLIVGAVLP